MNPDVWAYLDLNRFINIDIRIGMYVEFMESKDTVDQASIPCTPAESFKPTNKYVYTIYSILFNWNFRTLERSYCTRYITPYFLGGFPYIDRSYTNEKGLGPPMAVSCPM